MAARKYIVNHKSLYLKVNGKLQEEEYGSEISLDQKVAEGLLRKGFITDPSKRAKVSKEDG